MILKFIASESKKAAISVLTLLAMAIVVMSIFFISCLVAGLFLWTISFGMIEGVIASKPMDWTDLTASGFVLLMACGWLVVIVNGIFNFIENTKYSYAIFKQNNSKAQ